ncbi:MAG TPA: hypothetical protein VK651_00815 [Blastocatellia bacterium]|jgi:hypothetical protein|nr:hypothetical protein [Blastocatellia bacterium]
MSQIASQVHSKFKVFAGELDANKTIGPLAGQITKFVSESKVAAKSIGVEYIESAARLIITLGYRDDEPWYPVEINCVSLGKIDALGSDFAALEQAMSRAAQKHSNIICHELYVTDDREFLMIFMTFSSH